MQIELINKNMNFLKLFKFNKDITMLIYSILRYIKI